MKQLALLLLSPILFLIAIGTLAVSDVLTRLRRRAPLAPVSHPDTSAATVVIPNWNGRDLLAKYLPSVVEALAGNPRNEIIVVDNGSTDGSADFLRNEFPAVRVLALERNLGFGGGSNEGFRRAQNDVVVLLNNDMRVAPDFLGPLLSPFSDESVFAVSCQIFFTDESRPREETGLTQGWWENGQLRVRHRSDAEIKSAFPCFYGGGGSCAFDRRKFLELGGFDEVLSPFYLEDTDLGYMAWKRGWKVWYQPTSVVWHEHRGTIGKKFSDDEIETVLKKNYLLWAWKNIHSWRRLSGHFAATFGSAIFSAVFGDAPLRPNLRAFWRAFRQLPAVIHSRRRAQMLAAISDDEAFLKPMGGYFRDRFAELPARPKRLKVLFVSPYPIYPPVHGGGVFMYHTVAALAKLVDLHLIVMLDWPHQLEPHQPIRNIVRSVEFLVRTNYPITRRASIQPYAVTAFRNADLEWLIHRQILTKEIDVLQLEYTPLAQYAAGFHHMPSIVFEHDVYFQSIARGLRDGAKLKARFEYLRALHFEALQLRAADRIQVCSRENREYLESFVPELRGLVDDDLRAGIDTSRYSFRPDGREPFTILFLGSFRHTPNQEALDWFTRLVFPRVLAALPQARLKVVGSDPPASHSAEIPNVDLVGFVNDVQEPLSRYSVFVCPILSGSGVRVKLLEAFACGIPVVSTRLGAEGLTGTDGEVCELADEPVEFAAKVVELLINQRRATALASRAREYVVQYRDTQRMTEKLVASYSAAVGDMRAAGSQGLGADG